MSEQTILQNAPSNLDEDELVDALTVAPPSTRSVRFTRVLSALLLVALGATGATWWAQRDGGTSATAGRPLVRRRRAAQRFPERPARCRGPRRWTSTTTAAGTTGTSAPTPAATTGEVVLVDGAKVYVRTASGAVVTVTTSAGTTVTRAAPSTVAKLAAGDTVDGHRHHHLHRRDRDRDHRLLNPGAGSSPVPGPGPTAPDRRTSRADPRHPQPRRPRRRRCRRPPAPHRLRLELELDRRRMLEGPTASRPTPRACPRTA